MSQEPAPSERPVESGPPSTEGRRALPLWPLAAMIGLALGGSAVYFATREVRSADASVLSTRPSATLLVAVRDLARLETTDLHMEKVIDLTDTQSHFFGLVQGTDNVLLVAAGDVTWGVDLGKVGEGDVTLDPKTHVATMHLPAPEILSSRLDEQGTYVYARTTSLLAKRNEQLESSARREAIAALEKAAREGDAPQRSKAQAERELRALAQAFGATDVVFVWR